MSAVPAGDSLATNLAYALAYARLGWKVLPLEPGTKRPHKLAPRGVHSASCDLQEVRELWTAAPDAGVGVACEASGLVAIDIDPRNGGLLTLEALEVQHGRIDSAVQAITPGGGLHLIYAGPPAGTRLPATLGPGVDVKHAGYICVEPSVHPNGKTYSWEASSSPLEGSRPSPLPAWLATFARAATGVYRDQEGARYVPIAEQTWSELYAAMRRIDANDRDAWVKVGMGLHSTGEADRAYQLWDEWSQSSPKYDSRDQMRVWRSFRGRGLDGVTYRTVFAMAGRAEDGAAAPAADTLLLDYAALAAKAGTLSWAVKHLLPADSVGVLFGASGTFKSFVAIDAMLHVAHGRRWLGQRTAGGHAVYLAAEGGVGVLRRVRAWHKRHGLDPATGRFHFCVQPLALLKQAASLRAAIERLGVRPQIIVIDTMSQTFSGEENSANEVAEFMRAIRVELAQPFGACVLLVHHSGHSATERPRGSSAIRANTDFLFSVSRDETEMLCRLENSHQKDGELFKPAEFRLSVEPLETDADGDLISSLVAEHLNDGQQIAEAVLAEKAAGRSGHLQAFMESAKEGMTEGELRQAFYKTLPDSSSHDARKKAFRRTRDRAIQAGFLVIDEAAGNLVRLR